jgi:5-oxoprolinase (ATP-hydrolysing) subunit A
MSYPLNKNWLGINCDLGEKTGNDEELMPYISLANIACGYHAGDINTISQTIALCEKYNVRPGAHPSFHDPENFGRNEFNLTASEIYELIMQQLIIIGEVISAFPVPLFHVKPHGALYNLSARNLEVARAIANAVKDHNPSLVLLGLSNSCSITAARECGLRYANEAFADRCYNDDGTLVSRKEPGAIIENSPDAVKQVHDILYHGKIKGSSGNSIVIQAETICIHGDGENAVAFAKAISESLTSQ